MRRAIIAGIAGQDGSYLAELLVQKGYKVLGFLKKDEDTPHNPVTPYGVSKLAAHLLAGLYRRRYGMYVVSGILYNHESPRRQDHFVTQKIVRAAAEISLGRLEKLRLGNIDARRDWGYAGDFVRGIWLMLQQPAAADYVLATGETHSIRDYLQEAFSHVGMRWEDWVETDPALVRPVDVGQLVGNPSRAKKFLGWIPEVSFPHLVHMMVNSQLERLKSPR